MTMERYSIPFDIEMASYYPTSSMIVDVVPSFWLGDDAEEGIQEFVRKWQQLADEAESQLGRETDERVSVE